MRVRTKKGFRALATDGRIYQGIADGEVYLVFGICSDEYRLWDRDGEPILYPKRFFEVLDPRIPNGWVFHEHEGGEYHLEPETTSVAGFYEDYFGDEGDLAAKEKARDAVRDVLSRMRDTLDSEHRALVEVALERAEERYRE